MTDTTTDKPNLDWAPKAALTIQIGDQIRHDGFFRTVTAVRVTPGVSIDIWLGERSSLKFPAGTEVMVRTVQMQTARREAAKDAVDKLASKVQAKASGLLAKLTGPKKTEN